MNDPRFPEECYLCGEPIEAENELATTVAGWAEEDFPDLFTVPCHRGCLAEKQAQ